MDKQQYENMQKVMAISRIFCDRMRKFMDECGLLEQGFQFEIDIHNAKYGDDADGNFLASVELSKSISEVDINEYHATKFDQWKYEKRGWWFTMTLLQKQQHYRMTLMYPTCRSESTTRERRIAREKLQRMLVDLVTLFCGSVTMVVILLWFAEVI